MTPQSQATDDADTTREAEADRACLASYERALTRRRAWEGTWQECYDHTLPRNPGEGGATLYDGTAADCAEQLAASLLAELTPPWSRWFGLTPARGISETEGGADAARMLEESAEILAEHFTRSNFAIEMHQCFLDLVVAGTACLAIEEAAPGEGSALRFAAIPLTSAVLEEGPNGALDRVWRTVGLTAREILARFPEAMLPPDLLRELERPGDGEPPRHRVIEATFPDGRGHAYRALLADAGDEPLRLAEGRFDRSPFIAFRWLKVPGETYGRGPVMKALPDIRTANKVVELILKNASIAVTGIWQADDDGVLNPANIRLVPGAIIPKAVGSAGLTPLQAPGKFDVSQLILDDLRARIRHALLVDRLGAIQGGRMTATEVLERSAETVRVLGASYGRLQSELLTPVVLRALSILQRRGEIPRFRVDGRTVQLQYRSPIAQVHARAEAQNVLTWLQAVQGLGPAAGSRIDADAAIRWLARALGAPAELTPPPAPPLTAPPLTAPPVTAPPLVTPPPTPSAPPSEPT